MTPTGGPLHCAIHPQREAAARCASCAGFFCRECVTEHDLRMLCARCLRETASSDEPRKKRRSLTAPLAVFTQLVLGAVLLWFSFYLIGRLLIAVPATFHEGTLWESVVP
jgi:hypothetical protein